MFVPKLHSGISVSTRDYRDECVCVCICVCLWGKSSINSTVLRSSKVFLFVWFLALHMCLWASQWCNQILNIERPNEKSKLTPFTFIIIIHGLIVTNSSLHIIQMHNNICSIICSSCSLLLTSHHKQDAELLFKLKF